MWSGVDLFFTPHSPPPEVCARRVKYGSSWEMWACRLESGGLGFIMSKLESPIIERMLYGPSYFGVSLWLSNWFEGILYLTKSFRLNVMALCVLSYMRFFLALNVFERSTVCCPAIYWCGFVGENTVKEERCVTCDWVWGVIVLCCDESMSRRLL